MYNITREDILNSLRKIDFLERVKNLSLYRNDFAGTETRIDKKRINEIIKKNGYKPGYVDGCFCLKDEEIGNITFDILFSVSTVAISNIWSVYEEGEFIYGGPWLTLKRDLTKSMDPGIKNPSFSTYEELEEILSSIFKLYEDFKVALCKEKGIMCR